MTQEGRLVIENGRIGPWSIPFQVFHYLNPVEGSPYVSVCDLLNLASHGATREEAVRSMRDVIQAFLEDSLELGGLATYLRRQRWAQQADERGGQVWIPPRVASELAIAQTLT